MLICLVGKSRLRRDFSDLPTVARWLAAHIAPGTTGGERVSGSREAPVPVRLDVLSMLHHVHDPGRDQTGPPSIPATLKSWIRLICEHRGLGYPMLPDIAAMCSWLLTHVEWAAARPWIGDFMDEVAGLRRAAHGLVPWSVAVEPIVDVPCPKCDLRALFRTAGSDWIECDDDELVGGCGHLMSREEYQRHVERLLDAKTK
ncbi:hypothetical protein [Thermoactinospora rubra]|uniref:hypothetical protein n=1 Tax=Thermoactinospora rubra TaxID=1088767 RepID=UPI000A109184|nr:hypothetical protein [Thermoactinospora rubra]